MKINIWKLLLVAMVVPAVMGACKDDRNNYMVDDSISYVDSDGTWEESKGYFTVPVYDEKYVFPVVKNGKGLSSTTVRLEASESALAAYNTANETNYVALPENCYTFETKQLSFSKDDIRKFATITWDMSAVAALDPDTDYVIPVQLVSSASDVPVSEDRSLMLLNLQLADVSMALLESGTTSIQNGAFVYNGNVSLSVPVSTMDVEVKYTVDTDPALVEAYNAANGTSFEVASEGFASMSAASSVIKAGETTAPFGCQLNLNELTSSIDKLDNGVLVPVRITSATSGVNVATEVLYIPVKNGVVKGPWTLLEGENLCYGLDPNETAEWAKKYTADKLFDGSSEVDHEWISLFKTQNVFPLTFVVDMGAAHIFTNFIISDYSTHQGNYRDYELYVAEEYNGADTEWTLVAKGMRDYHWTGKPTDYDFPVQKLSAGRYLKFQIMKAEYDMSAGDFQYGRGKLGDVYGEGL
ncbi:DUF1735 domain-containing protein [Alistipes sp.]|uniref:DUF1735 domain-containing protein n=1 Tax=Alistipes sp. TaxID=1872444 RepID=UPI0025C48FB1|nr:DUF1735 domain-containing protein [Alistipes sp.]MCI7141287.1 DUF1735 domain-containing protein [Alistipes sp.]MDY5396865.1 DUF1735 domain-containing protein [Alistipes sp.]